MTLNRTSGKLSQKAKASIMSIPSLEGLVYVDSATFPKKSLILQSNYLVEEYFTLIFTSSLYDFLNIKLPAEPNLSRYKTKFSKLLLENDYSFYIETISRVGINLTIQNLLDGVYGIDDNIEKLQYIYLENLRKFDEYNTFTLRFKDSSGNLFGETEPRGLSVIKKNSAYSVTVLMDDTTVTEKTGFNQSEDVYIYYYNVYYQKEYLLSIDGGNITASLLSIVLAENVDTHISNKLDFKEN